MKSIRPFSNPTTSLCAAWGRRELIDWAAQVYCVRRETQPMSGA